MTDWQSIDYGVGLDGPSALVYPPRSILYVSVGLFALALICLFFNNWVGYALSVAASIAGGFTLLGDQRRRSDPNYVELSWFRPTVLSLRYLTMAIAFVHVVQLAIASAR